jgi:SET domain-containing protein
MQRIPSLFFQPSPLGGRGVFTAEDLPADALLEICPAIILPPEELSTIHQTHLHDYYFLWGEEQDHCAIALGFGSLYNHSYAPNARYLIDYEKQSIDFYSLVPIAAGSEILVNYNGDPNDTTAVWFDKGRGGRKAPQKG